MIPNPETNTSVLKESRPVTNVKAFLLQPWLLGTIAVWIAAVVSVLLLTHGSLPWASLLLSPTTIAGNQVFSALVSQHAQLLEQLSLIALTFIITRKRKIPDIVARTPELSTSRVEVLGLVAYAIGAQAVGYIMGTLLGGYAISLHLPELFKDGVPVVSPIFLYTWVTYNFIVYAVIPYIFFRWRGYSNEALSLKSSNIRADLLLIIIVLAVESTAQLSLSHQIFNFTWQQLLIGMPLTFVLYFFGTCLPVMVFIYSILVPRYLRLTNSVVATVILGGITYASVHFFDAWGTFNTPTNALLTVCFVFFQYFGPGMVKTVLTLRTGNAWTHVWAYHAIAPHVWFDTPIIIAILHIF